MGEETRQFGDRGQRAGQQPATDYSVMGRSPCASLLHRHCGGSCLGYSGRAGGCSTVETLVPGPGTKFLRILTLQPCGIPCQLGDVAAAADHRATRPSQPLIVLILGPW